MSHRLVELAPSKMLFACDSFEGFPQDRIVDMDLSLFRFRFKAASKIQASFRRAQRLIHFFETVFVSTAMW